MERKKLIKYFIYIIGICLVFNACQTPAGRTLGVVFDDATITTKIKTKYLQDPFLSGFAIGVKSFDGEVTLTGRVAEQSQKIRAEEMALNTAGVRKVINVLKVKPNL